MSDPSFATPQPSGPGLKIPILFGVCIALVAANVYLFLQLDQVRTDMSKMRESILIRDGYYCGRRFETDAGAAIWFVEENQVKVYRADGSMTQVLDTDAPLDERRAAA
jgi:hypothetical protein